MAIVQHSEIHNRDLSPILDSIVIWRNKCLVNDLSVFSDKSLWTKSNLDSFQQFYEGNLIEGGEQSFYEKLQTQLKDAPIEVNQLAAEMMWGILLFNSKDSIGTKNKVENISKVWGWSGDDLLIRFPELEKTFSDGVGNPGMGYQSYRWKELAYFINWVRDFKEFNESERANLLDAPWKFANYLDKQDGSGNRQFRHIILFLMYPELFEDNCSKEQKKQLVKVFSKEVEGFSYPVQIELGDSDQVIQDKELLRIRTGLEARDGKSISFYSSPYKEQWKPTDSADSIEGADFNMIDLTSSSNDFDNLEALNQELEINAKKAIQHFGDVRLSEDARSAIQQCMQGGRSISFYDYSAKVKIDGLIFVPNNVFLLAALAIPLYRGINKLNSTYKLVLSALRADGKSSREISETDFHKKLVSEDGVDLKKVFLEYADKILKEQKRDSIDNKEKFQQFVFNPKWTSGSAEWGKRPGRTDVEQSAILNAFGVQHASQQILFDLTKSFATSDADWKSLLVLELPIVSKNKTVGENQIIYGAPGTGKSHYLHKKVENGYVVTTVFHSETQNSDFWGGLKPISYGNDIKYEFVAGPFIKAFEYAVSHPDESVSLIVEEINRANAAAVFGEIFLLLDRDASGKSQYAVTADHMLNEYLNNKLGEKFKGSVFIPSNLSIYATMNSSDQGVFPLDSAFKRRWSFKYLPIDFSSYPEGDIQIDGIKTNWRNFAIAINKTLKEECQPIEEDRFLGPWFVSQSEINNDFSGVLEGKVFTYLWNDVLRHHGKEKIFNLDDKFSYGDLVASYKKQQSNPNISVMSEFVHKELKALSQPDVSESIDTELEN